MNRAILGSVATYPAATGFDHRITDWIVGHRAEPWTTIVRFVTLLGNTATLIIIVTTVTVALAVRGRRAIAAVLAAGSLIAWGLMGTIKAIVARDRPPVADRLLEISSYSFPSGHAMVTTVVAGLLALSAYRSVEWVRAHRWVLVMAPVVAVLVGLSRIYLGVHWTTDVVAGWAFGVAWVSLCWWLSVRFAPLLGRLDST